MPSSRHLGRQPCSHPHEFSPQSLAMLWLPRTAQYNGLHSVPSAPWLLIPACLRGPSDGGPRGSLLRAPASSLPEGWGEGRVLTKASLQTEQAALEVA